jgi:hypothetical protein
MTCIILFSADAQADILLQSGFFTKNRSFSCLRICNSCLNGVYFQDNQIANNQTQENMMDYNFSEIEKKWQLFWLEN